MMHVFVRRDQDKLMNSALEIARETGIWFFYRSAPTIMPAYQKFELVVGDATLDLTNAEIGSLFRRLIDTSE
jgi:hypothetical protein